MWCMYVCLQCTDIPAHNAMTQLARAGAVAVIGDICSAASVAAAGVAGDKQVPLISPASSSPQLSGMPFFARTVPSDRYEVFRTISVSMSAVSLCRMAPAATVTVVVESRAPYASTSDVAGAADLGLVTNTCVCCAVVLCFCCVVLQVPRCSCCCPCAAEGPQERWHGV